MAGSIIEINDSDFESTVKNSQAPVLIDFWAPWCGPCKAVAPVLEELAGEYAGKLNFVKMNVDDNKGVPSRFGIRSIPTLIIVKGGEVAKTLIGAKTKADLKKEIDAIL